MQSPGEKTRKAIIEAFPDTTEKGLVEGVAFVYAYKGDVTACQNEIKKYVGPYSSLWNVDWYIDMSGCQILAKKRTREDEEKDFASWLAKDCSKIINTEMRQACEASGAPQPSPAHI